MGYRRIDVPGYRQLLARDDAPAGSSWGVFGEHDQLGALNFQTPETRARAARLVRTGEVFNLDYPLNAFVPSIAGTRPPTEHHMFANNPNHRDDWLDSFYLQSTTQIDGLRHMRHPVHGFYGGVPDEAVAEGTADLGIQLVAAHGVLGRGVLLDMPRYFAATDRPYDLTTNQALTPDDLAGALAAAGLELDSGDVLLVHTGFARRYLGLAPDEQAAFRAHIRVPGLAQSPAMLEFLWDNQVSLVASDNPGVEAFPVDRASAFWDPDEPAPARGPVHNGMLHRPLLALLGILLGELWRLDELADACALDGRHEFLLSAKPLAVTGGVGSPANAMAIR